MNRDSGDAALQRLARRLRRRIEFVEGSSFFRLRARWLDVRRVAGFPATDGPPQIPERDYIEAMDESDPYRHWLLENEPRPRDLARMRRVATLVPGLPTIAVVVDDRSRASSETIASVRAQSLPVTLVRTSQHSSDASDWVRLNAAVAASDADVVAFCDDRSLLSPHAAFAIALAFAEREGLCAAYGDRDVVCDDGGRCEPSFLPDWSPETFLSSMYTGTTIFYRRTAVLAAGGFRAGFASALHYDLALRVFECDERIEHVAETIVHERAGTDPDGPERADGDAAVLAALARRGTPGRLIPSECASVRSVRYARVTGARVDVLIPTRDKAPLLARCLQSVFERNPGMDFRVTVIDNGSVEAETTMLLASYRTREPQRFQVLRIDEPFNFSRLMNAGVRATDAPFVLLLNNDTCFQSDDPIAAMLEHASRPTIGAVGARLLHGDDTIQHAGVVVGIGGLAGHLYRGYGAARVARTPAICGIRNYSAVTAACMMVERTTFLSVDGFDETFAVEFNDVDFCLRLQAAGFRNLYVSHVRLRHDESSSRGPARATPAVGRARERFRDRWQSDTFRDPYYNVNLTLVREDASIDDGS